MRAHNHVSSNCTRVTRAELIFENDGIGNISNNWSWTRGEAKQRELIWMTAEAEADMAFVASYGVSATTSGGTGKATQLAPLAASNFECMYVCM